MLIGIDGQDGAGKSYHAKESGFSISFPFGDKNFWMGVIQNKSIPVLDKVRRLLKNMNSALKDHQEYANSGKLYTDRTPISTYVYQGFLNRYILSSKDLLSIKEQCNKLIKKYDIIYILDVPAPVIQKRLQARENKDSYDSENLILNLRKGYEEWYDHPTVEVIRYEDYNENYKK